MLMIAHRGASGHAPENTMAAFRLALEMGARAIELDVHQTRDGGLLVIHDADFKRVGGKKVKVSALTLKEARAFDVGRWFDASFQSERAPTLEEVYDLARGKAELHVELKHGTRVYPGIEARLTALIDRRDAWETTVISSFDHQALFNVRALAPRARIGYLLGLTSMGKALDETRRLKAESLNLSLRQVDARKVKTCHNKDMRTLVYTVNTQKDLDRLAAIGVDGVFTNFPELDNA